MSRNRTIYQSYALYASDRGALTSHTGAREPRQFTRVQSWDDDFTRNLQDITQYGNLAPIDKIESEAPTVNGSFSYYISDGRNESIAGLTVTTGTSAVSCISGILSKTYDEKNYFLLVADEGNDASNYIGGGSGVISLGNGVITSYTAEAAVGSLAKATVNLQASNWRVYSDFDGTQDVPAVQSGYQVTSLPFNLSQAYTHDYTGQISALQPGDIVVNFSGVLGFDNTDLKLQSFNLAVDLARTPLQKLGQKFPVSREINFPLNAKLSMNAEFGDLADGNLQDLICQTGGINIDITLKAPSCSGNGAGAVKYSLRNAKLVTESVKTAVGSNGTMSFEYSIPIGGPQDTNRGVFISGSYLDNGLLGVN